jgi:hypothetical protein
LYLITLIIVLLLYPNQKGNISVIFSLKDFFIDFIEDNLLTENVSLSNKNNGKLQENLKKLRVQYKSVMAKNEGEKKIHNLYLKPNYQYEKIIRETISLDEQFERLTSRNVYLLIMEYDLEIKSNKHYQEQKINIERENIKDNACQRENEEKKHYLELTFTNNKRNLEEIDINDSDEVGNIEEIKIYSVISLFIRRNL